MSEITFTPCYPRIMKNSLLAESPYFGQKRRINRNITDDGACTIIQNEWQIFTCTIHQAIKIPFSKRYSNLIFAVWWYGQLKSSYSNLCYLKVSCVLFVHSTKRLYVQLAEVSRLKSFKQLHHMKRKWQARLRKCALLLTLTLCTTASTPVQVVTVTLNNIHAEYTIFHRSEYKVLLNSEAIRTDEL